MITSGSNSDNKKFGEAEKALSDVSLLLSNLCKSRKAATRLPQIIELTGVVARLTRALKLQPNNDVGTDTARGFGDPDHCRKISFPTPRNNIR